MFFIIGKQAEPEFIVCCQGSEMTRITGNDPKLLQDRLKRVE